MAEATEGEIIWRKNLREEILKNKILLDELNNLVEAYQIAQGNNVYLEYVFDATSYEDLIYRYAIIEELMVGIVKLIETINQQRVLQNKDPLFKLVIDSSTMEQDLRTPCYTSDQFVDFSSALYRCYFERTKETRGYLHKKYFSTTEENGSVFAKCTDLCRHIYGKAHERDEFKQRPGQFNISDMLMELTGTINEPYTSEEFIKIQTELLKRFKVELEKIELSEKFETEKKEQIQNFEKTRKVQKCIIFVLTFCAFL